MGKIIKFDDCISRFPNEIEERMQQIRQAIKNAVLQAVEVNSYQMISGSLYDLIKSIVKFRAKED